MVASDPADPAATADSEAATLVEHNSGSEQADKDVRLPPRIGRYTLIRKLGEGGMGAVYMAYDEELDRRVALKLLHVRLGDSESVRVRMQREAQALARISHPNVVQIYDVGRFASRLYVAMELIDGTTLRTYCRSKPRTWREVQAVMLQAGEGLAAAHAAGLIHRDIKPDNILVGKDGRVRVADFGLARSEHIASDLGQEHEAPAIDPAALAQAPSTDSGISASSSALNSPLTVAGTLLGTPAYMAPEQHMRQPADARADIYAFCVVLYEALYGERPFSGKTRVQLTRAIILGELDPPTRDPPVPPRLLRLIRRGLVAEPDLRITSMEALLVELRRDPGATRRSRLRLAGFGALVVGAAIGGAALRTDPVAACAETYATVERSLEEQRASVAEALQGGPTSLGRITWQQIEGPLGSYASGLHTMYSETCEGHRGGRISDSLHDLSVDCLDRRRGELVALMDLLAEGDAKRLEHTVTAVAELPPLSACGDVQSLLAQVAPPQDPETAAAVAELRATLDQLRAMQHLGEFLPAKPIAAEAVAKARTIDYPPVLTEALVEEGLLAVETAEHPRATEVIFPEALALAERTGDDEQRLRALAGLLAAYGHGGGTLDGMKLLVPLARALVERRQLQDDVIFGRLLVGVGESYMALGAPEEANAAFEEALGSFEAIGPEARVDLASAANGLAMLRSRDEKYDEAHALYGRAREALVGALGERHPHVGHLYNNEARAFEKEGSTEKAREYFDNALSIWAPAYGDDHEIIEIVTNHLARVNFTLGDLKAAKHHGERSLAIAESRGGTRRTNGVLVILARVAQAQGRLRKAESRAAQAQSVVDVRYGEDSPKLLPILELRAQIASARDKPGTSAEHLARAIEVASKSKGEPEKAAQLGLQLAKQLWDAGDKETARARAIAALNSADPAFAPTINIWLTEHPL